MFGPPDDDPGCSCGFGPPGNPDCPEHGAYIRRRMAEAPPRTDSCVPCEVCGKLFIIRHMRGESFVGEEQSILDQAVALHQRNCRAGRTAFVDFTDPIEVRVDWGGAKPERARTFEQWIAGLARKVGATLEE